MPASRRAVVAAADATTIWPTPIRLPATQRAKTWSACCRRCGAQLPVYAHTTHKHTRHIYTPMIRCGMALADANDGALMWAPVISATLPPPPPYSAECLKYETGSIRHDTAGGWRTLDTKLLDIYSSHKQTKEIRDRTHKWIYIFVCGCGGR